MQALHSLRQLRAQGGEMAGGAEEILERLTEHLAEQEHAHVDTPDVLQKLFGAVQKQEEFHILKEFLDALQTK